MSVKLTKIRLPAAPSEGMALIADFAAISMASLFGSTISVDDVDAFAAEASDEASASSATGDDFWDNPSAARWRPYSVKDGVLTIPVRGLLLSNFGGSIGDYATGYDYIARAAARAAADGNVTSVILSIHSPGGTVTEVDECAAAIAALAKVKPVVAYCNTAASAAYWLASKATKIVVSRTGQVGSIGVITSHFDYSEALAMAGIKYTSIFAGDRKADGSPNAPLSEEAKAAIQARINALYDVFVADVAEGRGMTEKAVRDTQAGTFDAKAAVKIGLADAVVARNEFKISALIGAGDVADGDEEDTDTDNEENAMSNPANPAAAAPEAGAKTYENGMSDALARAKDILAMDEAKGREQLAQTLAFDPSISKETAKAIMAAAPKAAEPAEAADPFAALMAAAGSPQVGPSASGDKAADTTDPQGQVAAMLAMMGAK